jgi:hypothetical protein
LCSLSMLVRLPASTVKKPRPGGAGKRGIDSFG